MRFFTTCWIIVSRLLLVLISFFLSFLERHGLRAFLSSWAHTPPAEGRNSCPASRGAGEEGLEHGIAF